MGSLFGLYTRVSPGEALRDACDALIELFARGLEPRGSRAAVREDTKTD